MGNPRFILTALLAFCLASCSSGPSEGEMKDAIDRLFRKETDAYNARVREENQKLGRQKFTERVYPVVADLKKIDCVRPDSKPGYMCYFTMSLDGVSQKRPGRFYQEQGDWVYARP